MRWMKLLLLASSQILVKVSTQTISDLPCNSTNTTLWCIGNWGPDNGYPAIPNEEVEMLCFTALNCCLAPLNTSDTGYNTCEWKDCGDTNSTAACKDWATENNSTVDNCFKDHGCCPVDQNNTNTSITDYVPCPPKTKAPLSKIAQFFIVEASILFMSGAGTALAYRRGWSDKFKHSGIAITFISAFGLLGTGIAAMVDKEFNLSGDSSSLNLSFTGGILVGAGLFAGCYYKTMLSQNGAGANVALLAPDGEGEAINNQRPLVSCCNCLIS